MGLSHGVPDRVEAQAYTETEVKAAFIYKFTSFVEWPRELMKDAATPFRVGILGNDPFGEVLDNTLTGKDVQGHPIELIRATECEEVMDCHIVYISPDEKDNYDKILQNLSQKNILTIGDSDGFAEQGGIINLVKVDNKIRFEVNLNAARKADLKISSQLLKIAPKVYGAEELPQERDS